MRRWLRTHSPMLTARLVLAAVYLWLGWSKIKAPVAFLKALREYDVFPSSHPYAMNLTVVILPWIEVTCGVLLIAGVWLRAVGVLLLTLTAAFTVAITVRAFAEMEGQSLSLCAVSFDCGCGTGEVVFCSKFFENVVLCGLATIVALSRSRALSIESIFGRTATGVDSALPPSARPRHLG